MVNIVSKIAITGVVFIAILYQFVFKTLIFGTLGYGRKIQSLKDFDNVRCEAIELPGLESCEDMWLHEPTGFLYMACSSVEGRTKWLPAFVLFLIQIETLLIVSGWDILMPLSVA